MRIMGILNVTPDSFSDGGKWFAPVDALRHADTMWEEGADIIDVGAESTRPGSIRISADEEWSRLKWVLPELTARGYTVSVDTVHADTAAKALEAGAHYINDISGGQFDSDMNAAIADSDARFIVQHWRGFPGSPGLNESYLDAPRETLLETLVQVEKALSAGVREEQIIVDPGLGFALTEDQSWQIVDNLQIWVEGPYPVLVGGSRKRFVKERYPDALERGTQQVTRRCLQAGVWGVRVHDVAANRQLVSRSGAGDD